jgi:AraC-like DNA-binding protein
MVTSLLRRLNHHGTAPSPSPKRERLQPLLDDIEHHPEKRLSLAAMADRVHLSIGHFSRLFKKVVGSSPQAYQRKRFMNHLSSRLARGESLKKIATDVAYSSPFALSRDFKKHFGVSPREYLRLYQRADDR